VDLLIAKHPPIFRAPKRLTTDDPQTKMYADLLKANITVYAAHTNMDIIENGLNDWFSELLGITDTTYLTPTSVYQGKQFGIGRVGTLENPLPFTEFAEYVKAKFSLDGLRIVSDEPNKIVKRVAICGGSGEKFYPDAIKAEADVYITGDIYYHTAHDMLSNGLSAIDPGHNIEKLCIPRLTSLLNSWKNEEDWDIVVIGSTTDTNPFKFI
jgi:dinuclear metal center YbgI/SA1388 family protein